MGLPIFDMSRPLNPFRQLSYVVRDMDAALKYWVDVHGAGPFFTLEHAPLANQKYRGAPSDADVSLAMGNCGALQIELISQNNDVPSVYKEFLDAGRHGVHHVGLMPEDYRAALQWHRSVGHEVAFECDVNGAELTYVDTVASVGHFTELLDSHLLFNGLFAVVGAASQGWDGKDPVRRLPL